MAILHCILKNIQLYFLSSAIKLQFIAFVSVIQWWKQMQIETGSVPTGIISCAQMMQNERM